MELLRGPAAHLHPRHLSALAVHATLVLALTQLADPRAAEALYRSCRTCIAAIEADCPALRAAATAAATATATATAATTAAAAISVGEGSGEEEEQEELELEIGLAAEGVMSPHLRTLTSLYALAESQARGEGVCWLPDEAERCGQASRRLAALLAPPRTSDVPSHE